MLRPLSDGGADMQRTKIVVLCSLVLLMLVAASAHAQTAAPSTSKPASDSATKPAHQDDKWEFRVTPYLWAVQIESKVTVGGYSATANTYFPDVWRNLEGAGMLNFEAQKGKLGFFLNPLYMKLRGNGELTRRRDASLPLPPTRDLTLTLTIGVVEFGGFYQVAKWPLDWKQGKGRSVTLDVLAGGRYWYIHTDLDTTSPINPSKYNNFVDPIIGARTKIDLTDNLALNLEGDIGGFGVGSEFTWNAQGSFSYQFTPLISAFVGYRAIYVDYKAGTGNRYEETFQGPLGGITFRF
jgi:hypothetical protein